MKWIHRAYVVLGLWTLTAPWILGYASITPARWSSLLTGIIILLLSLWSIFGEHPKNDDSLKQ